MLKNHSRLFSRETEFNILLNTLPTVPVKVIVKFFMYVPKVYINCSEYKFYTLHCTLYCREIAFIFYVYTHNVYIVDCTICTT